MTPTDLETLFDNWLKLRAERLAIPQVINLLGSAKKAKAEFVEANSKALTALLADYERMREGLDNAVQQLSELAQPLTPALNGSYAKGEQVGYENAVRIISALRATLKGEKHE